MYLACNFTKHFNKFIDLMRFGDIVQRSYRWLSVFSPSWGQNKHIIHVHLYLQSSISSVQNHPVSAHNLPEWVQGCTAGNVPTRSSYRKNLSLIQNVFSRRDKSCVPLTELSATWALLNLLKGAQVWDFDVLDFNDFFNMKSL